MLTTQKKVSKIIAVFTFCDSFSNKIQYRKMLTSFKIYCRFYFFCRFFRYKPKLQNVTEVGNKYRIVSETYFEGLDDMLEPFP